MFVIVNNNKEFYSHNGGFTTDFAKADLFDTIAVAQSEWDENGIDGEVVTIESI